MTIQGLTQEQLDTFDREGVICLHDFVDATTVKKLMDKSHSILQDFDISLHPKTKFKTGENDHIGDNYFFDSSDKVSFFFDVDAFDDEGTLKYPKEMAINKIGHALHDKDEDFKALTFDAKVQAVARSLNFTDPRVLQSMLIFKHPVKEGETERLNQVPPHSDGTFLYTEPQSAIGFWFALEDCTLENGCLSYHPGSHKEYPIISRFVKINGGDDGCNFMSLSDEKKPLPNTEDYVSVECKAGSLVLIHNSVLHKSENNRSNNSRFAYAFHLIDGTAKYDNLNWLQIPPCKEGGTQFSKLFSSRT